MSTTNSVPSAGSHAIPLSVAIQMTQTYRKEKEQILAPAYQGKNILATSETFNRDVFEQLLAIPGAAAVRVYYGMDSDLKVHAIFVAANEKNEDILTVQSAELGDGDGLIFETGTRCPTECPPPSPLNP